MEGVFRVENATFWWMHVSMHQQLLARIAVCGLQQVACFLHGDICQNTTAVVR